MLFESSCAPTPNLNLVTLYNQEEARRGKTGCTNNKFYLQVQRIRNYRCRDGQGAEPGTIIVVLREEIIWDVIKCFNSVDVIEIAGRPASPWKFSDGPFPVSLIGCLLCVFGRTDDTWAGSVCGVMLREKHKTDVWDGNGSKKQFVGLIGGAALVSWELVASKFYVEFVLLDFNLSFL